MAAPIFRSIARVGSRRRGLHAVAIALVTATLALARTMIGRGRVHHQFDNARR